MANSPGTISKPWPFHIEDRVLAVHYALDDDCPYTRPQSCPDHKLIARILGYYDEWAGYQDSE